MRVIVWIFTIAYVSYACAQAPYPPSGWRPKGPAFELPAEIQNQLQPQQDYGVPAGNSYLPSSSNDQGTVDQDTVSVSAVQVKQTSGSTENYEADEQPLANQDLPLRNPASFSQAKDESPVQLQKSVSQNQDYTKYGFPSQDFNSELNLLQQQQQAQRTGTQLQQADQNKSEEQVKQPQTQQIQRPAQQQRQEVQQQQRQLFIYQEPQQQDYVQLQQQEYVQPQRQRAQQPQQKYQVSQQYESQQQYSETELESQQPQKQQNLYETPQYQQSQYQQPQYQQSQYQQPQYQQSQYQQPQYQLPQYQQSQYRQPEYEQQQYQQPQYQQLEYQQLKYQQPEYQQPQYEQQTQQGIQQTNDEDDELPEQQLQNKQLTNFGQKLKYRQFTKYGLPPQSNVPDDAVPTTRSSPASKDEEVSPSTESTYQDGDNVAISTAVADGRNRRFLARLRNRNTILLFTFSKKGDLVRIY